jgi:hypothetical protein
VYPIRLVHKRVAAYNCFELTLCSYTDNMSFKSNSQGSSYSQIAELALNMSTKDQLKLAEELRRAGLKAKWDKILAAFRPNSISDRDIIRTCKEVRAELWEKRSNGPAARRG